MERVDELMAIFESLDENKRKIVSSLIEEAVFLEEQLRHLKQYPFIKFHPTNPNLQKVTAAGKQYREFLQTYTNIIDKLCRMYGKEDVGEESPLRAFLNSLENGIEKGLEKGLEVR